MSTPETVTQIPLEQLHESPFNPRKTYTGLDELAASIRTEGVLQPIVVRPRFTNPLRDDVIDGYEVVFGHRRLRAAELAGLAAIPCIVRSMSHLEARRAQLTENIQRADVHPIEEAEAFAELIDQHGVTAEQLAEQIGKSVSHVYARLTLRRLLPEVRERVLKGEVGAEVALLIARLRHPSLQTKALAAIASNHKNRDLEDGGLDSFRSIRNFLNERFTLELKDALFDPDDATLCPDAGTCTECPKRTGNAPEFIDIAQPDERRDRYGMRVDWIRHSGADICTDPDCFEQKKKAHLKQEAEALMAKGNTVIDGNKARQAIGADGKLKGGYIALAEVRGELKKAAEKGKVATVTIQDPRTGKVVKAVKADDVKAAGVKLPEPKGAHAQRDFNTEYRERERRGQIETERRTALYHALRAGMVGEPRSLFELDLVLTCLIRSTGIPELLLQLWGVASADRRGPHALDDALIALLPRLSPDQKALLLLDLVLVPEVRSSGWEGEDEPELLYTAARHYGLDPEAPLDQLQQLAQTSAIATEEPEEAVA